MWGCAPEVRWVVLVRDNLNDKAVGVALSGEDGGYAIMKVGGQVCQRRVFQCGSASQRSVALSRVRWTCHAPEWLSFRVGFYGLWLRCFLHQDNGAKINWLTRNCR